MRVPLLRSTVVALSAAAMLSACSGSADLIETKSLDGALIIRAQDGAITPKSSAAADAVVKKLLQGRGDAAPETLKVLSETTPRAGIRHLRMEQEIDGLRVYGAYVKAAINDQGQLTQVIEKVARPGSITRATVSETDALQAALKELAYDVALPSTTGKSGNVTTFEAGSVFHRAPSVERVLFTDDSGALHEGFLVETWEVKGNQLEHTLVSDTGAIVKVEHRTNNERYNVFPEDPGKTPQTIVSGGATAESPSGWLGTGAQTSVNITGNNAHAYLDKDANNAPDTGGTAVTNGDFVTVADLTQAPDTAANKNVAVQNLFYLNNVVHDILYRHGFDEAAGNFQVNNFGAGGLGNDPVNAEAQDGSGTDNANFSTPSDGSSPRMQMYLWSGAGADSFVTLATGSQYGAYQASFGGSLTTAGTANAALALYNDGTGVTSDGCEKATVSLSGKVAIIDRGTCDFVTKVLNAQSAGATAVVMVNNVAGNAFSMGGSNRRIKIPSVMVTNTDGASIKAAVGVLASLKKNPNPPLMIDGDVDSDVVFHEYGHGLTWRMVGSMDGALAGAIGEGASDTVAFLINNDDIVGEYAFSDPAGIRRYPYKNYPLTYSDVTGAEVHDDGEIFAAAMWRVKENYNAAGLTDADVMDDFVHGLNFTPPAPSYEQMRDGMLQAAAPARQCLIWKGYAATGIGVGATGTVSRRGAVTITESFAVPANCP